MAGNVDDARRSLFDTVMDIVSIHWRVCHVALGVAFIVILYSALAGKLTNAAATVRKIIVGNRIDGIPGHGERDDSDNDNDNDNGGDGESPPRFCWASSRFT